MKKNIKKFIICTTLSTMFLSNSVYAYTKKNVSVNIDNMLQPIKSNVINKDGHTLVAFRDLFEMLDAKVDWNDVKREITAKKDDKTLIINVDTNKAKLNDKYLDLPVSVEIIDGATYVPLRFVCEAFDMKVEWDSEKQKIAINTGKKGYIYLDDLYTKDNTKTLSQEEAVKTAQSKNSNIKNLNDAIEYSKKVSFDLNEKIVGQNYYDPAIESILRNINSLDAQVQDKDINQKIIEDSIELSVISAAANIKTTKLNIASLEKNIEANEKNIEALELKYKYGMISENKLKQAKDTQKNNKLNLEALKSSLKTQQQVLNNILGQDYDINVDIKLKDDFNEIDKIDIETYTKRAKEGDISIQLLKKNLERLEEIRKNYSHTLSEEDKIKADNDIKTAQRKLEDAKTNMENQLRSSYDNLIKMRDTDKTLKRDLEKSIDEYNKVAANYISGNATLNQVKQAELGILNVEKQIEQNKINFATSLYTFEKPYLSSPSSK
ncbi:stalk domain-containing protein [[Clostridium] colinum]|uniref:stalk domain-containing protein n=1 Tax=[Clostridium] colinum TaxID=36835 RepID=UPI00202553DA|nr:stalk domain-containing protein [[Clostridium] colinum]